MFFQHIAHVIVAHPHAEELAVNHYHLWHVALAFLVPVCALLFVGIYILDLRRALREADEENVRLTSQVASHRGLVFATMRNLRGLFEPLQEVVATLGDADKDVRDAGEVMTEKMQQINGLLEVVNVAHEQNQHGAQALSAANAQAEKNLADIAEVRQQQLQDAARLQDGAEALGKAQAVLFGDESKDPTVN